MRLRLNVFTVKRPQHRDGYEVMELQFSHDNIHWHNLVDGEGDVLEESIMRRIVDAWNERIEE